MRRLPDLGFPTRAATEIFQQKVHRRFRSRPRLSREFQETVKNLLLRYAQPPQCAAIVTKDGGWAPYKFSVYITAKAALPPLRWPATLTTCGCRIFQPHLLLALANCLPTTPRGCHVLEPTDFRKVPSAMPEAFGSAYEPGWAPIQIDARRQAAGRWHGRGRTGRRRGRLGRDAAEQGQRRPADVRYPSGEGRWGYGLGGSRSLSAL